MQRKVVSALSQVFFGYNDYFTSLVPESLQMLQFLEREVSSWHGLRILDAACGGGALAQAMAELGAVVTALEIDPTVIRQATELSRRSNYTRNPNFQLGSLRHLLGEPEDFQMLLALGNSVSILPNEAAYRSFLTKAATLLIPDGRLVLQLFNYDRIMDFHDYQLETIALPEEGIRVWRQLIPDDRGNLHLQSRVQILRFDSYELSNFTTPLWPVRRHQLNSLLKEAGFRSVDFYSDVEGGAWKADSECTLLVALRG